MYPKRKIGQDDVIAIGFGAMGMSAFYKHNEDPVEAEKKHLELLTEAADCGETFWDTSDIYGPFTNEELLGKWFEMTGRRKEIFLATKFGICLKPDGTMGLRSDAEYIEQAIDASLKRLKTDYVDLYYQHRVEPGVPIERTVGHMAELVKKGKVRYLGFSEISAKTLARAHKVHPIAAVQIEYSLFTLDVETNGLKDQCQQLGTALVAYSPLGRGMLTGRFKSRDDFEPNDWRLTQPRFSAENFHLNLHIIDKMNELAAAKGCTSGQLALAWLLRQGDNVIPIPGTRHSKYLQENLGSMKVELSDSEVAEIRRVAENADIKGDRYSQAQSGLLFVDTVEL